MLIEQYNSQFSETNEAMKATKEEINNTEDDDLAEIIFSEEDISNAIGNLKKNSVAGPEWHTSNISHKYQGIHKSTISINPKEKPGLGDPS